MSHAETTVGQRTQCGVGLPDRGVTRVIDLHLVLFLKEIHLDAIKGAFLSKTMWFGLLAAVLPVAFKPVQEWVAANPSAVSGLVGAVIMALRAFTDQSLAEKGTPPNDKVMTP